jgi:hypothetical protein
MNHLAQLVSLSLITVIAVASVTPGFDLETTIASLSRLVQLPLAIILAGIAPSVRNFSLSLLRTSYHISDYHPANLIDLNCIRRC